MARKKNPARSTDVKKRKGPSVSANSVNSGTRKRGNDGQMWTSKRMPQGYNRWVRGAESQVTWQDDSGFSRMIRELIFSDYLDVYYIERYRHRLSIDGVPLYYFAIAGRKTSDIPDEFLELKGMA